MPPWTLKEATFDISYGENVSKKVDPLFLSTIVKERIDDKYAHSLQIFTDGSIDQSGDGGSAFVVPKSNVTRSYKLNRGVSVFTAELYAIFMALTYLCNLSFFPKATVILSDSRSSLQALYRGGTKNRNNLQLKILKLIDSIIGQGTNISLMWLPSHIGIRGNELADSAAKKAKSVGIKVNLGYSISEAKSKVRKACFSKWKNYLKLKCVEEGWIFLGDIKCHIPNLPRKNAKIISRIRTMSSLCLWTSFQCQCKAPASFLHAASGCKCLQMAAVNELCRQFNLASHELLIMHPDLGEKPMRMFSNSVIKSNILKWF